VIINPRSSGQKGMFLFLSIRCLADGRVPQAPLTGERFRCKVSPCFLYLDTRGTIRRAMRIRDLILPEDKVFFVLFKEMAQKISEASATLNEITHEIPNGIEKCHKVRQYEHKCDEITRQVYEQLNESLITPLEPEEISRLAPVMDDVMDRIDRVTQQICNYELTTSNETLKEFSYLIMLSATEIMDAVSALESLNKPEAVKSHSIEINRIYNLSIELQAKAVLDLFKTKDLLLIIKLKDIYEGLGLVMEKCNDVGHALNDIAMSHA
jgi:hypothetical protein